jgi:D-alanyl-D-alanine carboxypeptidase (penicillin-binding protein 5/6)
MLLVRLFALLFVLVGLARAEAPPPPPIAARAWLLLDFASGQSIISHNPDERVEPASLTKLMTAYLVFDALRKKTIALDQTAPVSQRAWKAGGSRMFIEPRKPVTVEELMRGMIIQSGNDATIALAELIAGSEEVFAEMMNREAQRLGMKGTNFTNASGATLAAALIRDFPDEYALYSTKEYRYNNITQPNRNRLLWLDPNVDGVKTGYTEAAGYCLIASAKRGPRRLVSVVLGTNSDGLRAQESQKLLNYGFQFFDTVRLYEKGQEVGSLRVWKGSSNELKAGVQSDLYLVLPRGDAQKLKADFVSEQPLLAPVDAGQRVGTIKLSLDGRPLGEYPVVALESVRSAGMFGRALDSVRLWFK